MLVMIFFSSLACLENNNCILSELNIIGTGAVAVAFGMADYKCLHLGLGFKWDLFDADSLAYSIVL